MRGLPDAGRPGRQAKRAAEGDHKNLPVGTEKPGVGLRHLLFHGIGQSRQSMERDLRVKVMLHVVVHVHVKKLRQPVGAKGPCAFKNRRGVFL